MNQEEEDQGPRLTLDYIKKMLRSDHKTYYSTPELNEVLYLQCKGFSKIENLHLFPDLRCLYIQSNAILRIEGLQSLKQLKCLYLNENMISKIEGLEGLCNLRILNLADNRLTKIEGLGDLTQLETLNVSKNNIGKNGLEDVEGVLMAPTINSLDVSKNDLTDGGIMENVFMKMPSIALINMMNNEAPKKIQSYRKKMIASLPTLKYLDDRPVFPDDRRCAEAFARGGLEEERKERERIKQEKEESDARNRRAFEEMIHRAREEAKAQGNPVQSSDELETTLSTGRSESSEPPQMEAVEDKKEQVEEEKVIFAEASANPNHDKEELTRLIITDVDHDIGKSNEKENNAENLATEVKPEVKSEGVAEETTKLPTEEVGSGGKEATESKGEAKKDDVPPLEEGGLDLD
eukprot:TRINITY_DN9486_c0_g1_i3.p1 TRINITY_DN9486_c0_g1~~TRINITY_DN9486_c0_g1_i3.p1  ORF type:complete len:406 (+),score=148.36 TRINITY_DN9486_c0_g1_i3:67-1284(+)